MSLQEEFQQWFVKTMLRSLEEHQVKYLRELEEEEATKNLKKYGGKDTGSAEEQPASA